MVASYRFRENVNLQVVLWALAGAVVGAVRAIIALGAWLPVLWVRGSLVAQSFVDDAAVILVTLWVAVVRCAGIAAIVGAVALLLANPVIVLCLLGIAIFGWATYPRSK